MDSDSTLPPVFARPTLAVSACLLGQPVRYDGGHKRLAYLTDTLAAQVELVALCPEAGSGLGVPRAPIQLIGDAAHPRALAVHDPTQDVTAPLQRYARERLAELRQASGCLLKRDSPSCGLRGVKLRASPTARARRRATGIFAAAVQAQLPWLPLEQEDVLDVPWRRDSFLLRLYTYSRWQELLREASERTALERFHRLHLPLVMARSQAAGRRLTRYVQSSRHPWHHAGTPYIQALLDVLRRPATRARHHRVLRSLADSLQPRVAAPVLRQLHAQLQAYENGSLPFSSVHAALRRCAHQATAADFCGWLYLDPYPPSLRDTKPETAAE